jgi:hypothetical protein
LIAVTGCTGQHTIGTNDDDLSSKCCVTSTGDKVSACGSLTGCKCAPELCNNGTACKTDADCPQLGIPCQACADGTTACPVDACVGGQCKATINKCGAACNADSDCVVPQACQQCSDGSTSCYSAKCTSGQCVTTPPSCGAPACTTDKDCPQPALGAACMLCADGSQACPGAFCVSGQCKIQYPKCPPPGTCKADTDCAAPQVCQQCADGTSVCAKSWCDATTGQCQTAFPSCPTVGYCNSDGDCKLVDDYCGGCKCDAIGPGQSAPTCTNPVQCLKEPCQGQVAHCLNHACVSTSGSACTTNADCPTPGGIGAPCKICPNGTTSCPSGLCVGGSCQIGYPPC